MKQYISILFILLLSTFTRAWSQGTPPLPPACTESWVRYSVTPDPSIPTVMGFHYNWMWDKVNVLEHKIYGNGDSIDIKWSGVPGLAKLGVVQSSEMALTNNDGTTTIIGCTGDTSWAFVNITGIMVNIEDTVVCEGQAKTFIDDIGLAASYTWNDTLTAPSFTINTTKADTIKIWVRGTSANGCTSSDTAKLFVNPKPVFDILVDGKAINDTMLCEDAKVWLNAGIDDNFHTWSSSDANYPLEYTPEINVAAIDPLNPAAIRYHKVVVENSFGCEASDSVAIIRCTPPDKDNVPIAFTPNGDGKNDTWNIPYLSFYPNATVDVYDRWGNVVFNSKGSYKAWDGLYAGKKLPMGTYYYIIKLAPNSKSFYGNVMIIR